MAAATSRRTWKSRTRHTSSAFFDLSLEVWCGLVISFVGDWQQFVLVVRSLRACNLISLIAIDFWDL